MRLLSQGNQGRVIPRKQVQRTEERVLLRQRKGEISRRIWEKHFEIRFLDKERIALGMGINLERERTAPLLEVLG